MESTKEKETESDGKDKPFTENIAKKSHKVDKTTDVCGDSVLTKHALSFPLY